MESPERLVCRRAWPRGLSAFSTSSAKRCARRRRNMFTATARTSFRLGARRPSLDHPLPGCPACNRWCAAVHRRSRGYQRILAGNGYAHRGRVRHSLRFRAGRNELPARPGLWSDGSSHGVKPSGSSLARDRTARYCRALIAPSFLLMVRAVSATEKPCRNLSTMHSCCSGLSRLTASSSVRVGDMSTHSSFRAAFGTAVGSVGVQYFSGGDLQPVAARLEVVGDQVTGDGDQPGAEVATLPGEAADPAEGSQEGLGGEVLGQLSGADPKVDEPEDGVHVPVVDQPECFGIAGLRTLHEPPDIGGRFGYLVRQLVVVAGRGRVGLRCRPARRLVGAGPGRGPRAGLVAGGAAQHLTGPGGDGGDPGEPTAPHVGHEVAQYGEAVRDAGWTGKGISG